MVLHLPQQIKNKHNLLRERMLPARQVRSSMYHHRSDRDLQLQDVSPQKKLLQIILCQSQKLHQLICRLLEEVLRPPARQARSSMHHHRSNRYLQLQDVSPQKKLLQIILCQSQKLHQLIYRISE